MYNESDKNKFKDNKKKLIYNFIVEERDYLLIPGLEKETPQIEYIDEILISELWKPENEIQLIEEMYFPSKPKPFNQIDFMVSFKIN